MNLTSLSLFRAKALLTPPSDGSTIQKPELRSGIYIVLAGEKAPVSSSTRHAYVIYWPEPSTWDDDALDGVRRNRVTFMRFELFGYDADS